MRRALALAALVAAGFLATAAPAGAHADLESTDPPAGAALAAASAPAEVTLRFTERVELADGAIRVYDGSGDEVPGVGRAQHADRGGAVVTAPLPPLTDGPYVVSWRVLSQDNHPITGSFTFAVGNAEPADPDIVASVSAHGNRPLGIVFGAVRALAFASVLLLVGIVVFVRTCWPAGASEARVRRAWWTAWAVALLTAVAAIGLQAAYVTGGTLADVTDPDAIADVLDGRFGRAAVVRFVLVAIAAVLVQVRARAARVVIAVDVVFALALLATLGAAGHASTGRWRVVAIVTDLAHLGAAAVWLGGIVVLLLGLTMRARPDGLDAAVRRFSPIAGGAIAVVAASGVVQAVRQSGGIDSLFGTTYGRLVVAKVALLLFVVAAASVARDVIRGPDRAARAEVELRRAITAEVAFAAAILAVSAALVYTVPARDDSGDSTATEEPASEVRAATTAENLRFEIAFAPGVAGASEMTVTVTDDQGRVFDPPEITAEVRPRTGDVAPIEVPLTRAATGRYTGPVTLPFAGTWTVEVRALRTEIDQTVVTADVEIGEPTA